MFYIYLIESLAVTVTVAKMTGIGIDSNSANLSSLTGAWDIPSGHKMFVTYSGVPTMFFFVKP